jgi:hypothetical protein
MFERCRYEACGELKTLRPRSSEYSAILVDTFSATLRSNKLERQTLSMSKAPAVAGALLSEDNNLLLSRNWQSSCGA